MLKLLLNIYIWFVLVVLTALGLVVLPFIILVNVTCLSRTVASALRRAIRFYGWVLVCVAPFWAPVTVDRRSGQLVTPSIFVANHTSALDPFLFGALAVENSFVTSWPFKIPLYGLFMRLAGYANTAEGWPAVREKCNALLSAGSSVIIWPEGHRSRNGMLGRFKSGAFALAVETGIPVTPVCILGADQVLPPETWLLKSGKITLVVLEPIYPEHRSGRYETSKVLRRRVYTAIERVLKDSDCESSSC